MTRVTARIVVPLAAAALVVGALTGCGRMHPGQDASGAPADSASTQTPAPTPSTAPGGDLAQDDADLDAADGAVSQSGGDLGAADQASQSGDAP
ncbi:hypothetical protein [Mesorhizobium japonicum]|uniref:hypothetical protein n=1 Tax=Mesorhizobium japonicum TaxID=2066070 RepID=UPI003B5BE038